MLEHCRGVEAGRAVRHEDLYHVTRDHHLWSCHWGDVDSTCFLALNGFCKVGSPLAHFLHRGSICLYSVSCVLSCAALCCAVLLVLPTVFSSFLCQAGRAVLLMLFPPTFTEPGLSDNITKEACPFLSCSHCFFPPLRSAGWGRSLTHVAHCPLSPFAV